MSKRIERRAQPVDLKRRNLLKAGLGIGVAIAAAGIPAWLYYEKTHESGPFGTRPAEHIDRELLNQILSLEASYNLPDLRASKVRDLHLELSAELFSRYAGETMTKQELAGSVQWLDRTEFDKQLGNKTSAAYTSIEGNVYLSEQASQFTPEYVQRLQTMLPWWSALSAARMSYEHEWYHRAGIMNLRTLEEPLSMSRYYYPMNDRTEVFLTGNRGFTWYLKRPGDQLYSQDNALEETFAYLMTTRLEKSLTGLTIEARRDEEELGTIAADTNRGVERFAAIFSNHPSWVEPFQQYHRESNPIAFGQFLADQTKLHFANSPEKTQYGLDVLMAFTRDVQGQGLIQFFQYLK